MAENFFVVRAPQVDSPEMDMAQLRRVAFVRKLGEHAQLRTADGQLHLFLRARQTLQQMRVAVSGKLNPLGFRASVCQLSEDDFAQQLAAASRMPGMPESELNGGSASGAASSAPAKTRKP